MLSSLTAVLLNPEANEDPLLVKIPKGIHLRISKGSMSKQEEVTDRPGAISRRFVACTQSTGRVGKSTVTEGLIT